MTDRGNSVILLCAVEGRHARFARDLEAVGQPPVLMHNVADLMVYVHENRVDAVLLSDEVSEWQTAARDLKHTPWFAGLPLILILGPQFDSRLDELRDIPFDDYVVDRGDSTSSELLLRLYVRRTRLVAYLHSNPLTNLPGNLTIAGAIDGRIDGEGDFAICYVDIDNFKAFNDSYGFAAGDDLIRMTARVIENVVRRHAHGSGFVGHIGGDDFVFITPADAGAKCCEQVIGDFEKVSRTLYREEDVELMAITVENRRGEMERFPLPTLSIAGIDSKVSRPRHTGDVASLTAALKKKLKRMPGSHYMFWAPDADAPAVAE